jgi:hypothetical protein
MRRPGTERIWRLQSSLLSEKNINVKGVSEMLDMSQVPITVDLYQRVTPTMQHEAADTVDQLVGGDSDHVIPRFLSRWSSTWSSTRPPKTSCWLL